MITYSMQCCGIGELDGLSGTLEQLKRQLAVEVKRAKREWEEKGLLLATTIPSQVTAITALRSKGFEALMRFKNPNTSNMVTLWGKRILPGKKSA